MQITGVQKELLPSLKALAPCLHEHLQKLPFPVWVAAAAFCSTPNVVLWLSPQLHLRAAVISRKPLATQHHLSLGSPAWQVLPDCSPAEIIAVLDTAGPGPHRVSANCNNHCLLPSLPNRHAVVVGIDAAVALVMTGDR